MLGGDASMSASLIGRRAYGSFLVEAYRLEDGRRIRVVRDDQIPGGTKQRVLERWLPEMGPAEYVYASPAEGYAQIALARALEGRPDYRAHIFVARRREMHYRTREAQRLGALITEVDNVAAFSVVAARAREYVTRKASTPWPLKGSLAPRLLPFGLDAVRFRNILVSIVKEAFLGRAGKAFPRYLADAPDIQPKEVWCTVGSGTLIRCLQDVWPAAKFCAVQVGHNADIGQAERWIAPERFSQRAAIMPPFPSCDTYDAKAWRFIEAHASDGALFWNVAADPSESGEEISKISSKVVDKPAERPVELLQHQAKGRRRNEMTMATANYKKHTIKVEFKALDAITISGWTLPDGKDAPQKVTKPLFKTFESAGKAGRAALEAVLAYEKLPELPADRRMVFYEAGEKQPINARNVGSAPAKSKTAKAAKEDKAPVSDKQRKNDATATKTRNSRRNGPVTTRRAAQAEPEEAAPKSRGRSRAKASDAGEDLDI